MLGLLVAGLLLVHFTSSGEKRISQDKALEIARPYADFRPTGFQIRFLRRGIPSHGYWLVSYYIRKPAGGYKRITVVLVDATSGRVTEVRRTS
jgi:hypothetical protein